MLIKQPTAFLRAAAVEAALTPAPLFAAGLVFLDQDPVIAARAREVLTEVGNILLNACLGMFGNLLDVRVSFSVPRLHMDTLDELLASLIETGSEPQYALVVYTAFHIRDNSIKGFLVMVLSVSSLDRLIQEVEAWEERQGES